MAVITICRDFGAPPQKKSLPLSSAKGRKNKEKGEGEEKEEKFKGNGREKRKKCFLAFQCLFQSLTILYSEAKSAGWLFPGAKDQRGLCLEAEIYRHP